MRDKNNIMVGTIPTIHIAIKRFCPSHTFPIEATHISMVKAAQQYLYLFPYFLNSFIVIPFLSGFNRNPKRYILVTPDSGANINIDNIINNGINKNWLINDAANHRSQH